MNGLILKPRLAAIAAFVPTGASVADIGTDHAYLPVFLLQSGVVNKAIAADIHAGPYRAATETVAAFGLLDSISVRFGNGLSVLAPSEADTVVIAGMGASTIIKILEASSDITNSLTRLILQPMTAAAALRRWLVENSWNIVEEELVEEDQILYEIIVAERGSALSYQSIFDDIGPRLWANHHPLLRNHIERLIAHYSGILAEMSKSPTASATIKYREYARKIADLEEKFTCL
ncbi:MAG: hypothetical protein H6Q65_2420 [Firmicutes bacterium]|nr:hypothetical protein [Bacillota bacterium]